MYQAINGDLSGTQKRNQQHCDLFYFDNNCAQAKKKIYIILNILMSSRKKQNRKIHERMIDMSRRSLKKLRKIKLYQRKI